MGRKKRKIDFTLKPFCYYCDREFDDEKILIQHQKAKHFKCTQCHRKLDQANSLAIHMLQVHKTNLKGVPNSLPKRNDPELIIKGMNGVPSEILEESLNKLKEKLKEKEKIHQEKHISKKKMNTYFDTNQFNYTYPYAYNHPLYSNNNYLLNFDNINNNKMIPSYSFPSINNMNPYNIPMDPIYMNNISNHMKIGNQNIEEINDKRKNNEPNYNENLNKNNEQLSIDKNNDQISTNKTNEQLSPNKTNEQLSTNKTTEKLSNKTNEQISNNNEENSNKNNQNINSNMNANFLMPEYFLPPNVPNPMQFMPQNSLYQLPIPLGNNLNIDNMNLNKFIPPLNLYKKDLNNISDNTNISNDKTNSTVFSPFSKSLAQKLEANRKTNIQNMSNNKNEVFETKNTVNLLEKKSTVVINLNKNYEQKESEINITNENIINKNIDKIEYINDKFNSKQNENLKNEINFLYNNSKSKRIQLKISPPNVIDAPPLGNTKLYYNEKVLVNQLKAMKEFHFK